MIKKYFIAIFLALLFLFSPQIESVLFSTNIAKADPGQVSIDIDYIVDPSPTDAYWVGETGNWSDATNHWSLTSGGAPTADAAPGTTTNVYFDSSSCASACAVTIDADQTIAVFTLNNANVTITASNNLTVSGNWANTAGTFSAGTKTVTLSGTSQVISGSTTFYNLTKSVASADTLTFTAGTTQTIASGGKLILRGASGQLLTLASSAASVYTIAFADTTAKYVSDYISVSYATVTGLGLVALNSTNGGNNTGVTVQTTSGTLRYWIATSTANWNDTANWSTTSGGSSGSSVPTSTSDAIFDGNANGNCTVNATVDVKGLYLAGYSGTFNSGSNTVTIGTDAFVQGSGTFTAPSTTLTVSGNFTKNGGTFTHNSGTVTFTTSGITKNITTGGATFNNVIFSGAFNGLDVLLVDDMDINGNLIIGPTNATGAIRSSGIRNINLAGNFTYNGTYNLPYTGGPLTITLDGGLDQIITHTSGGVYSNLIVAKSGGSALLGSNFTLTDQTLTINAGNTLDASSDGGTTNYNLSTSNFTNNGTFYARSGTHSLGAFSQPGASASFNGGNSTLSATTFSLSDGTFTSTSGVLTVTNTFNKSGGGYLVLVADLWCSALIHFILHQVARFLIM